MSCNTITWQSLAQVNLSALLSCRNEWIWPIIYSATNDPKNKGALRASSSSHLICCNKFIIRQ